MTSPGGRSEETTGTAPPEHPVNGLCLLVKGGSGVTAVKVDGKPCEDARIGVHTAWDGPSLVVWIPVNTEKPLEICLEKEVIKYYY